MSSSSSDSEDFEPIRKIKINIRPKGDIARTTASNVNEIKASVEAWRPLCPPPHSSLSKRQSSLSSVASMSFSINSAYGGSGGGGASQSSSGASTVAGSHSLGIGADTTMRSSPSCSSLVNEFSNRSSFSNFMSTVSRTSSPMTMFSLGDGSVPIAIAIQESIELIVRGHYDPFASEPKFDSRSLGNIKVAFSNSFAKSQAQPGSKPKPLKLRLRSTDNVVRYFDSGLVKDLNLEAESMGTFHTSFAGQSNSSINGRRGSEQANDNLIDSFDSGKTLVKDDSKVVEFDMESLVNHLKNLYEQNSSSRYYNIDILRYQIASITSIEFCPLQVCAYWKIDSDMIKIRIDFKHSNKAGFGIERLREISFTVDLKNMIPPGVNVILSKHPNSTIRQNNNNNLGAMNMNNIVSQPKRREASSSLIDDVLSGSRLMNYPPLPLINTYATGDGSTLDRELTNPAQGFNASSDSGFDWIKTLGTTSNHGQPRSEVDSNQPSISFEPQATWDCQTKRLCWKFETLLSYHKTDGMGSLLAKLDFRHCSGINPDYFANCKPANVDVKFLVVDSTLSKLNVSIDSTGYRMSLLKKEIRTGRYISEPYIM